MFCPYQSALVQRCVRLALVLSDGHSCGNLHVLAGEGLVDGRSLHICHFRNAHAHCYVSNHCWMHESSLPEFSEFRY